MHGCICIGLDCGVGTKEVGVGVKGDDRQHNEDHHKKIDKKTL